MLRTVRRPFDAFSGCTPVAKPNYSFEKRQRELEKKKKKAEKAQKKANPGPSHSREDDGAHAAAAPQEGASSL